MNTIKHIGIVIFLMNMNGQLLHSKPLPLYFCTGCNSSYFGKVLNLIGSIHKVNFNELGEIAVFDLGLTQQEIDTLATIEKVSVHSLEKTHPDLLTQFELPSGFKVLGWYAWKPVILKQALDLFPYVLWLDAGTTVFKPLDNLFRHIVYQGYFLATIGNENTNNQWHHPVGWSATSFLVETFDLKTLGRRWILAQESVMGGIIGVARKSAFYTTFLKQLYEYTKDLRYFADDGTTPTGYGSGRHDQTIMSIMAYLQAWHVYRQDYTQVDPIYLAVSPQQRVPLYITWDTPYVCEKTDIYSSRGDPNTMQYGLYIHYKSNNGEAFRYQEA